MHTPLVSIVILNWNGKGIMQQCMPSVVNCAYSQKEIIVVDNASTDDSVAWLQAAYPQIKTHIEKENGGFSIGNNAGMQLARGTYIVLLNNDVEVDEHWLTPLVNLMEAEKQVAAVQPKMLQYDKRDAFEYAGACGGMLDKYGYGFARGRLFNHVEKDEGQYDANETIFWACGAAIMLRKSAIESLLPDVLDPRFFMHFEEIDLCWKLQSMGWQIKVVPQSKVYHIGGASLKQGNPRKTYFNFRNSLLTLYKNYSKTQFDEVYQIRKRIDVIAYCFFCLKGEFAHAKSIKKAYQDFKLMRLNYQNAPQDFASPILYPKSILWKRFRKKP